MGSGARPPKSRRLWRSVGKTLPLLLILAISAALRLYGLNWDSGHWLHPDERQIYFVTISLGWPHSLAAALSPDSPLNPHFFAYGSLPIYVLKLVAALVAPLWSALHHPDNLHLIGRPLAALTDLGTVYLTYRLACILRSAPRPARSLPAGDGSPAGREASSRESAVLAAALVGFAVLHVQIAHFYTVDTLLTFTVMLTLNLAADVAQGAGWRRQAALGVALGLALATKVSAAPLFLVVFVAHRTRRTIPNPRSFEIIRRIALTLALAGIIFVLTQPYALIDWQTFLNDTIRESEIARGRLDTPYTIQYAGTWPFLYSIWQTAFWGLGVLPGLIAWAAFGLALIRWLRRGPWTDALLLAWAGPYLLTSGFLRARYLRYMLPLVPILCLLAASLLANLKQRHLRIAASWAVGISSWAYALAFVGLYAAPHPWIAASEWIYKEVPGGSTLAVEHWDTALPLPLELEGAPRRIDQYGVRVLPLYDEPDDAAKWKALATDLADTGYLILASRRLYGSIPRLPDRYPVATRYYDRLFAGDLGFEAVAEFSRGPAWLNPRIAPLPGAAPAAFRPDESFVVYDHPRTLILRNVGRLSADELLRRLGIQGAFLCRGGSSLSDKHDDASAHEHTHRASRRRDYRRIMNS